MQKLFGVSTKLSWQIFKLTGPGDALSLAPHIPKGAAMNRVLEGAEKYGVAPRLINEVRAAYSAFEELIETHAGDRTSFESMTRGLSGSRTRVKTTFNTEKQSSVATAISGRRSKPAC